MNKDRWLEIKQLFEVAGKKSGPDRQSFLEELGQRDPELRLEVESLLEASRESDGFLDTPAVLEPEDSHEAGAQPEQAVGNRGRIRLPRGTHLLILCLLLTLTLLLVVWFW